MCLRSVTLQGLPPLVLHEIQLLKDAHHTETEEEKISSSSLRSRLLGTVITGPKVGCGKSLCSEMHSHLDWWC